MSQAHDMSDPDPSPTLGELIADCRVRRHLSRPQLAVLIGASLSSVKNWESDRVVPSSAYLSALEEALGVRIIPGSDGHYRALDEAPEPAPAAPTVVVIVASTPEAMNAALDRAGVPRAE